MSEPIVTEIADQVADNSDTVKKIVLCVVAAVAVTSIGGYAYRKLQQKKATPIIENPSTN